PAERAVVALHQLIPAYVLHHSTAPGRERSVRQGDAEADQEGAWRPESQPKRPGPSSCEQAADGVAGRVERIKGQNLARLAELRLQSFERDPRFDADHHVGLRVLDHAVEAGRVQPGGRTL